jgi:hypothetical protein
MEKIIVTKNLVTDNREFIIAEGAVLEVTKTKRKGVYARFLDDKRIFIGNDSFKKYEDNNGDVA